MQTSSYEQMSDIELITASQRKDHRAFTRLMKKFASFISSHITQKVNNSSEAEDLIQETYIRIWKSIKGLREPSTFRSWLTTLIRNLVGDHYRKAGIRRTRMPIADGLCAEDQFNDDLLSRIPASSQWSAESSLESSETYAQLRNILSQIDPIYRIPLLRAACGEPYESISRNTGLCMGTVKSRIARGRAQAKVLRSTG